jgi:hypothetical protein
MMFSRDCGLPRLGTVSFGDLFPRVARDHDEFEDGADDLNPNETPEGPVFSSRGDGSRRSVSGGQRVSVHAGYWLWPPVHPLWDAD